MLLLVTFASDWTWQCGLVTFQLTNCISWLHVLKNKYKESSTLCVCPSVYPRIVESARQACPPDMPKDSARRACPNGVPRRDFEGATATVGRQRVLEGVKEVGGPPPHKKYGARSATQPSSTSITWMQSANIDIAEKGCTRTHGVWFTGTGLWWSWMSRRQSCH